MQIPAQLVFGEDMILNINHAANWDIIKQRKQKLFLIITKGKTRSKSHTYNAGDKVILHIGTEYKCEQPYSRPYTIIEMHTNGTVNPQVGLELERVNI